MAERARFNQPSPVWRRSPAGRQSLGSNRGRRGRERRGWRRNRGDGVEVDAATLTVRRSVWMVALFAPVAAGEEMQIGQRRRNRRRVRRTRSSRRRTRPRGVGAGIAVLPGMRLRRRGCPTYRSPGPWRAGRRASGQTARPRFEDQGEGHLHSDDALAQADTAEAGCRRVLGAS